jgi:hypothetical protein
MKKYMAGGDIDHVGLEDPYKKGPTKKPLPSETIKEDKPVTDKVVDVVKGLGKRLKDNVMGTEEQNRKAAESLKRAGYKAGGKVSSASKRADGCAVKGKTRGKIV